jgi:hypothetical protein
MMSDLLVVCSIALLPFWCLDAKGGEVVLFWICSGLVRVVSRCKLVRLICILLS